MMRPLRVYFGIAVSALALTGCAPQVPDSGAGVGFDDYSSYELERARREAALRGQVPQPPVVPPRTPTAAPSGAIVRAPSPVQPTPNVTAPAQVTPQPATGPISSSELASAGLPTAAAPAQTTPVAPAPSVVPAQPQSNPGISDEQSFEAVTSRETIESDAERRARQAAAYQQIEATALPTRNGQVEPNLVQYALQAPNNRGQRVFDRSGFNAQSRFQRNCAVYRTPDEAQRDFLTRGGPQRDRLGLDPDGDGFACGWDPQAFRSVINGN